VPEDAGKTTALCPDVVETAVIEDAVKLMEFAAAFKVYLATTAGSNLYQ